MKPLATAEPYDDPGQQADAGLLGMWVFLATELMFFGPLLLGYLHLRTTRPVAFREAGRLTHLWLGTANTAILLTSSLTMALAVRAARLDRRRALVRLLAVTAALGAAFLVVKGVEYHAEWREALVPRFNFGHHGPEADGVAGFYLLYFAMTGLHALHLAVGIGVVCVFAWRARTRRYAPPWDAPVEAAGLYWHFVDIVWVFLYPLIYLNGRH